MRRCGTHLTASCKIEPVVRRTITLSDVGILVWLLLVLYCASRISGLVGVNYNHWIIMAGLSSPFGGPYAEDFVRTRRFKVFLWSSGCVAITLSYILVPSFAFLEWGPKAYETFLSWICVTVSSIPVSRALGKIANDLEQSR